MFKLKNFSRGDTIIEVMLAFAVFSMLAVGALTVMNQGTAGAQDSLETTLVREQIDNQAETLRFLHQAYLSDSGNVSPGSLPAKFGAIIQKAKDAALVEPSHFGDPCTQTLPVDSTKRFVLNTSNGSMVTNVFAADDTSILPYAQLLDDGSSTSYGLWIEPVISNAAQAAGTARYIDFHIRACWNSASSGPQRTLGTIVRLYVPENVNTGTGGGGETPTPTPDPGIYSVSGAATTACYPHKDYERSDADGNPVWGVFAIYPGDPTGIDGSRGIDTVGGYPCVKPSGANGGVYGCANYDARYNPGIPAGMDGMYKIIINYYDWACGGNPIVSGYNFKIAIYVNGTYQTSANLGITSSPQAIVLPNTLHSGDTVEIRWWNNHFFGDYEDPDLYIEQLTFQRVS